MRNTQYNTSQRFIERFDLDLVTLKANVPPWYKEHLTMLVRHACLVSKPPSSASAVLAVIFRCCSCSWLLVLSHVLSDDGLYGKP